MKTYSQWGFYLLVFFYTPLYASAIYTNSIGMQFINISAGSFFMGSCKLSEENLSINKELLSIGAKAQQAKCPSGANIDENASDNEIPEHQVIISKAFYMGKYEVTIAQFKQFINEANRKDLLTEAFIQDNSHGDNAAVSSVSWHDANDFIRWLNQKENTNTYRLPTEAEWEYVARAGTNTFYSWGNKELDAQDYAWNYQNAFSKKAAYAHQVGQKSPNPLGFHDIHGNVWEWVTDWYSGDYYKHSTLYDPNGRGGGQYRVNRGGSWYNNSRDRHLRSSNRGFNRPNIRSRTIGFRVLKQH